MRDPQPDLPVPKADLRPLSAQEAESAAALVRWADSLRAEVEALEPPDFDELARAVDGELDLGERALWQERLAHDPHLARRAAELERFRAEIAGGAKVLPFGRRPARFSLSGWIAAAAVLLFVVAIREIPRMVEKHGSVRAAVSHLFEDEVFVDGFEDGDISGWSTSSPTG